MDPNLILPAREKWTSFQIVDVVFQVERKQARMAGNWKMDYGVAHNCQADVDKLCKDKQGEGHGRGAVLKCLVEKHSQVHSNAAFSMQLLLTVFITLHTCLLWHRIKSFEFQTSIGQCKATCWLSNEMLCYKAHLRHQLLFEIYHIKCERSDHIVN